MLADPLVLRGDWTTITADGGEDNSLAALERAGDHSTYGFGPSGTTQEAWRMFIGHQYGKRNRFTARLTVSGLVPDLLIDNNNSRFSQSCYVVFDCPSTGPVNPAAYTSISLPNYMMKTIGGLLISVDTADPTFARVLLGET